MSIRIDSRPSPTASNGSPPTRLPTEGRNGKGQFTQGNRFARGNPHARRAGQLRTALLAGTTPSDFTRLAQRLLEQALDGDIAAAKLLLEYTIGPPLAAVDPDELDLHELDLARRQPHLNELVLLANRATASCVVEVAADSRPKAEEAYWVELRRLQEKYGLPLPIECLP